MVESATLLTLPRMCDLALNTPEVGVVNFTVLHSLLQVMISQLNLTDTNVEFRGLDSERIQQFMSASTTGNALTLTEYTIGGPDHSEGEDVEEKQNKPRMTSAEKGSKDESHKEKPGESPKHSGKSSSEAKDETHHKSKKVMAAKRKESLTTNENDRSTVILVENSKSPNNSGTNFTVTVTKDHFQQLEDKLIEIEERMRELEALPGNEKIIHALA
nr:uncharacterized protein LOC111512184 [Leptinotarsa decemlineata]